MSRIFVTYGDKGYEAAKLKIVREAEATREFSRIYAYGRDELSSELLESDVIKVKRGGGLWSWKPDVILSTMLKHQKGDTIVYCDAGCTVSPSPEWKRIWRKLEYYDIIAQRIFQKTSKWTRREIIEYFKDNGTFWLYRCQFQATIIIIIISDFTLQFVKEWRDLTISHPEFVMDVPEQKLYEQYEGFKENRHDQAIYSALVYKYLADFKCNNKIYTQWEHIEDYDPIFKQAIRATRLRHGQVETSEERIIKGIKRLIKDYIFKPFYYSPRELWYSKKKYSKS